MGVWIEKPSQGARLLTIIRGCGMGEVGESLDQGTGVSFRDAAVSNSTDTKVPSWCLETKAYIYPTKKVRTWRSHLN